MDRARAKSRCHQYCDSKNRTASFHGLYSTPHLYVRDPSDSRASLGRDERKRRVPFREENTSPTARTLFVSLDRADAIIEGAPRRRSYAWVPMRECTLSNLPSCKLGRPTASSGFMLPSYVWVSLPWRRSMSRYRRSVFRFPVSPSSQQLRHSLPGLIQ